MMLLFTKAQAHKQKYIHKTNMICGLETLQLFSKQGLMSIEAAVVLSVYEQLSFQFLALHALFWCVTFSDSVIPWSVFINHMNDSLIFWKHLRGTFTSSLRSAWGETVTVATHSWLIMWQGANIATENCIITALQCETFYHLDCYKELLSKTQTILNSFFCLIKYSWAVTVQFLRVKKQNVKQTHCSN